MEMVFMLREENNDISLYKCCQSRNMHHSGELKKQFCCVRSQLLYFE